MEEQKIFFETFYREHIQNMIVYAYRRVGDWEEARSLAQQAFMVGYEKLADFSSSENPIGWIKKTIQYTTANFNRTKKRRNEQMIPLEELRVPPSAWDEYDEGSDTIARCKEILSPEEYAMVEATVLAGEPSSKVYQRFGLSYEAFRKRVSRALRKLRDNWDK